MRLEIAYETQYTYEPPVAGALTVVRMVPRDRTALKVRRATLIADPGVPVLSYTDGWGTRVDVVQLPSHNVATMRVEALVETGGEALDTKLTPDAAVTFRADSARVRCGAVLPLLQQLDLRPGDWNAIEMLATCLRQWFTYRIGVTDAATPIEAVVASGEGVCQDLAHVFIGAARSWGWPARYASGYVYTLGDAQGRVEATAMHAWAEIYREELGWVGLDPTHGCYADDRYVLVGTGRDYDDVRPVRGIVTGAAVQRQQAQLVVQYAGAAQ